MKTFFVYVFWVAFAVFEQWMVYNIGYRNGRHDQGVAESNMRLDQTLTDRWGRRWECYHWGADGRCLHMQIANQP